jgi:hypothetical protein
VSRERDFIDDFSDYMTEYLLRRRYDIALNCLVCFIVGFCIACVFIHW